MMVTMRLGFSLLLVFGYGLLSAQPKGSLLIIGGGKRPKSMVEFMISEAKLTADDHITILPWASAEPDSSSYYAKKQFQELGHQVFFDVQLEDLNNWNQKRIKKFLSSKLIYIPGGDQRNFMEVASEHEIIDLIKKAYHDGALIAGTSAGAAIMSQNMITGTALKSEKYYSTFRTLESENLELDQGLGMLPEHIIIDQHFVWRSRYNRLLTAVIEHPDWTGWGIEESTAAFIKNGKVQVVGKYQMVVFKNLSNEIIIKDGLLGAEDINLKIYLPGDEFVLE